MKEKIEKLKAAQALYAEKNEFSVGQIVTWKDDMKNDKGNRLRGSLRNPR